MGRRRRIDAPGTWHHLMNRGSAKQDIFHATADRHLFLDLLGVVDRRCGVETHAFCLMGNHYHLLVRSELGQLSAAMQHLGAVFTRQVNERRGVDGPIFRGRFHSVLLTEQAHLFQAVRYIHRNPLDIGWRRRLEDYPWSSHGPYVGTVPSPWWLHQRTVLDLFGRDVGRYQAFVESHRDREPDATSSPAAEAPPTTPAPGVAARRRPPTTAEVVAVVADLAAVPPPSLSVGRRGHRNDVRLAAVLVAAKTTHLDASSLATAFGFDGPSGVRSALGRARTLLRDDADLRALVSEAIERLTPAAGDAAFRRPAA
jgi:putative transposase